MPCDNREGHIIDHDSLPVNYPTHKQDKEFWEALGRVVATFGFLEEVLAKAIFAFTATTEYKEEDIEKGFSEWILKLERALFDPLGSLIDTYGKAIRDNSEFTGTEKDLEELLTYLREASKIRNVLCHGSWRPPNKKGASIPFFVNRQKEIFETAINADYLNKIQLHTTELTSSVINTVLLMGYQFPGSNWPGEVICESGTAR